jgi:hypothetical protein
MVPSDASTNNAPPGSTDAARGPEAPAQPRAGKKAYRAPELVRFGDVAELTRGGSAALAKDAFMMSQTMM